MKILFQNAHFVAALKPAGVLSVPARVAEDPRPILGRLLEAELGCPILPIHRLDAEVSGLVLYALTPEAHRQANSEFENRRVQKTYQAFSRGGDFAARKQGTWKAKLLRGKKRAYESPVGKLAVTDYELVGETAIGSLEWRLFPKTGRSHQLRWELYRHDSPILGDTLYGSTENWKHEGIALRSLSLQFEAAFSERFDLPSILHAEPWE